MINMSIFGKKKKEKEEKEEPRKETVKIEAPPVKSSPGTGATYKVLVKPYVTEKISNLNALNKYGFRVGPGSNKIEIKKAIEGLYGVKVEKVAVLSTQAKTRRLGRQIGRKPGFKKAIVTLREGDKIDVAS